MVISTLFGATLLLGTTSTFADTITPEEPTTPPSGEVTSSTSEGDQPADPVLPPDTGDNTTGGDSGTTAPLDPGETGTTTPPDTGDTGTGGGDTGTTTPPDTGNTGTGGTDTDTTTPLDTGNTGTGGTDTGTTTPPDTGKSGSEGNTGTTTPSNNGGKTTTPTVNVGVNSDGTISQSRDAVQTIPIQTNNVSELTHIPTAYTPVETETGEKIVSVIDGVPYKQTEQGLTPITANITKLPSGNIAVKGSDGQVKVLPKTGEEATSLLVSLIGGILTTSSGWFFWKKRRV